MSFVGVVQILRVSPSFPFGIEGGMWDVIVLIPNICLSIYFVGENALRYVYFRKHFFSIIYVRATALPFIVSPECRTTDKNGLNK